MLTILVLLLVVLVLVSVLNTAAKDTARGLNGLAELFRRLDAWLAKKQAEQRARRLPR